jgi:uncharacterized protein (TIGR02678 family)
MTLVAEAAAEERVRAMRALLMRQMLTPADAELALARRHREELSAALRDHLGATLTVTADTAHLGKAVSLAGTRPLRLEPRNAGERRKSVDERRALGGRGSLLACLLAGVLERRGWTQVPLGALADEVLTHGRGLQIELDWRARADRLALLDAIELLTGLGVLTLRSGVAGALDSDDEAFYDVHRRRLALLLVDPVRCAEATRPDELELPEREAGDLAGLARSRRLLRILVEDPVLYLDDLDEDDRAYFLSQRARLESLAEQLTGLEAERRREGTALIAAGRELTDRPFPAQGNVKQLALLLLPELCRRDAPGEATISCEALRAVARTLVARHDAHWPWDAGDAESVSRATEQALAVLCDLRLVEALHGAYRVLPAAHRYRDAKGRSSTGQLALA